jgi:hypothetical protein
MNKQLMLVIILVSMIPGIVASVQGISGLLIANTTTEPTNNSINSSISESEAIDLAKTSGLVLFYTAAAILLAITALYLVNIYKNENSINKKTPKTNVRTIKTKTTENKVHNVHQHKLIISLKTLTQKIQFANISDDKAEKYMVFVVGLVAVIGILIIVLR